MRMPSAGTRDRKIEVYGQSPSKDDYGQQVLVWTYKNFYWAQVIPVKYWETLQTNQQVVGESLDFVVDYTSNIGHKDRIKYNGSYYEIESIYEVDRKAGLQIRASRKVDGQSNA